MFVHADIIASIRARAKECSNVFGLIPTEVGPMQRNSIIHVGWQPPPSGWVKLNTYGSVRDGGSHAPCGGLLRNDFGVFLGGFSCKLSACTIMQAELLGIWYRLRMAKDRNLEHVIIEVDSRSAICFLDGDCDPLHPCAPIVHDIKSSISQFMEVKWLHSYREEK